MVFMDRDCYVQFEIMFKITGDNMTKESSNVVVSDTALASQNEIEKGSQLEYEKANPSKLVSDTAKILDTVMEKVNPDTSQKVSNDNGKIFFSEDEYNVHPLKENDAVMSEMQYNAFKRDILANGQRLPILLANNEANELSIIDGRMRYKACKDNSMQALFKVISSKENLTELISSLEVQRKHYSKEQLACYAAEAKEEVLLRNREMLSNKMKAIAKNDVNVGELPQINTSDYLQEMFGVGKQYINQAQKILKFDVALFQKVKNGTTSLKDATNAVNAVIEEAKKSKDRSIPLAAKKNPDVKHSFIELAKLQEYKELGVAKKIAEAKLAEKSEEVMLKIETLKSEDKVDVKLKLPKSVNSYLVAEVKNSNLSISELFTEWVIRYTTYTSPENN